MGGDYMPHKDEALGPFLQKLVAGLTGHETAFGTTTGQVGLLGDASDAWTLALTACQNAQTALDAAVIAKVQARATAAALVRAINAKAQVTTSATPEMKANIGLPVHDTAPSRAPAPSTRPLLVVDTSQRLQHKLTYRDESTPTSRAKPAGVREIEVWCKIGSPAPADASECKLVGTSSGKSLLVAYVGADAGKSAYYMARWKNAHAEFGPWSETVVATIGA